MINFCGCLCCWRVEWDLKVDDVVSVRNLVLYKSSFHVYRVLLTIFRTTPLCRLRWRIHPVRRLYHQPTRAQFVPPDPGVLNQYFNFDFFNVLAGMDGCLLPKIQPAKCRTKGTTHTGGRPQITRQVHGEFIEGSETKCLTLAHRAHRGPFYKLLFNLSCPNPMSEAWYLL